MNKINLKKIGSISNNDIYIVLMEDKITYLISFPRLKVETIKFNLYLANNLSNKQISLLCKQSVNLPHITIIPITKEAYLKEEAYLKDANNITTIINNANDLFLKVGYNPSQVSNIINLQGKCQSFIDWLQKKIPNNIVNNNLLTIEEENHNDDDDLFNTGRFRANAFKEEKQDAPKEVTPPKEEPVKEEPVLEEELPQNKNQGNMNYNLLCILVILALTGVFILRSFLIK